MSQKELDRHDVIKRTIRREITVREAGELLRLSERQIYNLKAKVKEKGAEGLIHTNRGKPSNRRMPETEHQQIVNLLRKHYPDFKPTHASEKLDKVHSIKRDPKTIRLIMITEGLWKPRKPKSSEYRSSRPRKEYYGEMEQFDGSYEHWFEDRASKCCLLASIDDATNRITQAQFGQDEGVFPVFTFWQDYLLANGKPRTIYLDRLRTYYNNILPEKDEELLTQFQRAMKELGIELIVAHSPQAKGRIENLFKTLQDRLIKEMRLKNISDIKLANQFLKQEFIPWFNQKYGLKPVKKANLHQKLNQKQRKQLPAILSHQSKRVIQNDFSVRFNNRWYQFLKEQPATIRPKEKVIIEQRLDNQIYIRLRGKYLNYQILLTKPEKQTKNPWIIAASQKPNRKPYIPAKNHPWRTFVINPKPEISISLKT
jgi:transposase